MEGIGRGIGALLLTLLITCIISVPLGLWKLVELISWAFNHVRIVAIWLLCALCVLCGSTAFAAQFTLTWTDNSTNETGFTVERAPGLAATTGFVAIANVGANITSYVDAGLPNATAYSYRLCAFNVAGKSGYSNTASGTTPPPVPASPGAPTLDSGPVYEPPVVVISATLTMQGGQILAANVVATPEAPAAN